MAFAAALVNGAGGVGVASTWINAGPEGGFVEVLAIDPSAPETVYAGTRGGGLFKTTDGGATWKGANVGLAHTFFEAFVADIAIDPVTTETLYATTQAGLFKTTDGGTEWTMLLPTGLFIAAIAIDPTDPQVVYVGSSAGVFKSVDGGSTWSDPTGVPGEVLDLIVDPTDSSVLYAGTTDGVFKTFDGGDTWQPANLGLPAPPDRQVVALALDPTATGTLYAGTFVGLFRTTDGGAQWTQVLAGFASGVAIDPHRPNTAYAVAGGVMETTDAGATWRNVSSGLPTILAGDAWSLAIHPDEPGIVYAGTVRAGVFKTTGGSEGWTAVNTGLASGAVRALAIAPMDPTVLYVGTEVLGLSRSVDSGRTWQAVTSPDLPSFGTVDAIAMHPEDPERVFIGFSPGLAFRTDDGGESWLPMEIGRAPEALVIDPVTPSTMYAGTGGGGVFKSLDGGATWGEANVGLTGAGRFVGGLAIDPKHALTVYAATFGGVFKTTDGGTTWAEMNNGVGAFTQSRHDIVVDPASPNTVYAGFGSSLFKTVDGGANWTQADTGIGVLGNFALAIDPTQTSTIYAGTSGLFRSLDGAGSWEAFGSELIGHVDAVVVDPTRPTRVYAGTFSGVHVFELCAPPAGTGCKVPTASRGSRILLASGAVRLKWKWARGSVTSRAEFGDPTDRTQYALCLYDHDADEPRLVFDAWTAFRCGDECWRRTKKGFKYRERSGSTRTRLTLREGMDPGTARITFASRDLPLPSLPLNSDPTVTVQLVNTEGACWAGRFSATIRNDTDQFRATSD